MMKKSLIVFGLVLIFLGNGLISVKANQIFNCSEIPIGKIYTPGEGGVYAIGEDGKIITYDQGGIRYMRIITDDPSNPQPYNVVEFLPNTCHSIKLIKYYSTNIIYCNSFFIIF